MFDTHGDKKTGDQKSPDVANDNTPSKVDKETAKKSGEHVVAQILAAHANDSADQKDVGPSFWLPDFDAMAARRDIQAELMPELEKKWGVPPKAVSGLFDSPDATQDAGRRAFAMALKKAVRAVNGQLEKHGSSTRVTEAEIATNCLAEGSILYLWGLDMTHRHYDGALPTTGKRDPNLESQMDPGVTFFLASGVLEMDKQMKDPRVASLLPEGYDLNDSGDAFANALTANAAIYTSMIPQLIEDIGAAAWAKLPPEGKFYWKTIYYNRGRPRGRAFLHNQVIEGDVPGEQNTRGLEAYKGAPGQPTLGSADGEQNKGNSKFNAAWRTATFELLTAEANLSGADVPDGEKLLPTMHLSFVEGLELEQAMASELFSAAPDQLDERRVQEMLLLARTLQDWRRIRSDPKEWNPATWARVNKEMPRVIDDRAKAERLLASRHGIRGKEWPSKAATVAAFYKTYAAKLNRSMPRLDLMTDEQFRIEWTMVLGGLNGYLPPERDPGYVIMKHWFDATA